MPDAETNEPCEFLPWDSEFWGFPVARVREHTLTPDRVRAIDAWCQERSIACLYFLATFDDPKTVLTSEDGGFHLVDCRVTATIETSRFAEAAPPHPPGAIIRPCTSADVENLRQIASDSYRTSRFYFDQNFPRKKCGMLYEQWIAESCSGFADEVFVAEMAGTPVGYITCHLPTEDKEARIGLINVAREARRRGIGQSLIDQTLHWYACQQVAHVLGITQARNMAIQSFNDRLGFVTRSFQLWYHKWYRPPNP